MKYALIKSLKCFILVVKQSSSSGKCNTSVPCQYEYHVDMMLLRLKKQTFRQLLSLGNMTSGCARTIKEATSFIAHLYLDILSDKL